MWGRAMVTHQHCADYEGGTAAAPREPSPCLLMLGTSAGGAGSARSGYQRVPAPQNTPQRDICSAPQGREQLCNPPRSQSCSAMTSPQPPHCSQQPLSCRNEPRQRRWGWDRAVLPKELGQAPPRGSHGSARQPNTAQGGPGTIQQQQHHRVTPHVPVGLRFLQELHLVLNTGARLQLLHHHLSAADA